jgi:hypothetical protein
VTSAEPSGPAASEKALVWFPDTSALVSLAVHLPLQQAVQATVSAHRRVLVTAVVAELEELAKTPTPTAAWAGAALGQLDWLGEPVRLDDPAGTELAAELQEQIAAGRPLKHALEHFGEAAIISLGSRARTLRPLMLSDDYDARIAAKNRNVEPLSVHKLMHLMISQRKVTTAQAFGFADALNRAGRAQDYTAEELASGRLGRVGQP